MALHNGLSGQTFKSGFATHAISVFLSVLFPLLFLSGCSNNGSNVSVAISPSSAQSVMAGQTVKLTATVANDSKSAGVTWKLSGAGVLSAQTTTSLTYTAPSPVTSNSSVTITATSVSDTTKSASVSINLQAVTVSASPNSQTLEQGQTASLTATVTNDPGSKGVTWSLNGAGALSGQTASSVTYTAPASITAPSSATVTATSVFDTTKTASITINLSQPPVVATTSLPAGTTGTAYSATLAASGGVTPYTWSVSSGALPSGLNLSDGTISGTPTTAGTSSFTVQVKDAGNFTATASLSITINTAPLSIKTTSLPNGVVNSAYDATLQSSGGTPPVTWGISSGTLPGWASLNASTGVITGTPATSGTTTFTVKATDSSTPTPQTATQSLSITVNSVACSTGSESMLNGQYAFVLKGFDNGTGSGESSAQPALVGGVITVDGSGHVTAGAMDMNLDSGVQTNLSVSSGTYNIGSDQRGCMTLTTSAGATNYRFALANISSGVASTGHMIDFDTNGPFMSGILRKQTSSAFSTSQVTGDYAFGVSSIQNVANQNNGINGGKFAAIGVLNFSSGTVTGGEVDFNNNGQLDGSSTSWPSSPDSILSGGSYNVSASNGRGTLSFTPNGTSSAVTATIYVVSSSEILILGTNNPLTDSVFAGEAFQQSGTFSNSSLSGTVTAYQSSIGSSSGTIEVDLTSATFDGAGNLSSSTQIKNDGGNIVVKSLTSGTTYSVASTGRVLVSSSGSTASHPVFYLASSNKAFLLGPDSGVEFGMLEPQTSTATPNGTFAFGSYRADDPGGSFTSGVATFNSSTGAVNGSTDQNNNSNGEQPNQSFSNTFSMGTSPSGIGLIPSGCTIGGSTNPCSTVFLMISATRAAVIDATPGTQSNPQLDPNLEIADQ